MKARSWLTLGVLVLLGCDGGTSGSDPSTDGCGDGICSSDETCESCAVDCCSLGSCTPTTCAAEGKDCGTMSDGCGVTLACGTCTTPEICGGTGRKDVCGDGDTLATATGCAGVFNPDQLLDLHLTMSAGDWSALKQDTTNSILFPAEFRCGAEPPLPFTVAVRRKRSGSADKPGIKIDFNELAAGEAFYTLKKLSLENGISETGPGEIGGGTVEASALVAEYMAWRMMVRSGAIASRAVFARLFVNGALIGVYVNVEQVDRRFLRSRLGDDTGWLYKHSGSTGDGYKTNEGVPNPYEDDLCFFDRNSCAAPSPEVLATYLPQHLDVQQMLLFGGVNAILANSDAPFVKENNFYWYDSELRPRLYLPWDLDTTMKDNPTLFNGPGTTLYTSVLFTHWEDDYDVLLTGLLAGELSLANIEAELARVRAVAGAALDADPLVTGTTADAVATIEAYWAARHPQLVAELQAHAP